MKYLKFRIKNYRAIKDLEIDLEKNSLIPIIGINECGKTTILKAIFAFDWVNDNLLEGRSCRKSLKIYMRTSGN